MILHGDTSGSEIGGMFLPRRPHKTLVVTHWNICTIKFHVYSLQLVSFSQANRSEPIVENAVAS
jgi:hypothetical protein